ncbi:MAG: UvrD-helicase domain-containing protein [Patescibacteria group bacterium]
MDLSSLNKYQLPAVYHTEGPALVVAGPGSGKTRVLTFRVANLIEAHKVAHSNILVVTFTNKAAKEIKERLNLVLKEQNILPWAGTFHSICSRILRKDGYSIGISPSFVIYDDADQKTLIRNVLKELNIPSNKANPYAVLGRISSAKNELITPEEYKKYASGFFNEIVAKAYPLYQKKLKDNLALDFDDLIMETVRLFETVLQVLEKYQNQFLYILIDEYQDTNRSQYVLSKLLAQKHKNIFVVGDMAQAIYSFRGADVRNILNFEKDYKNAKTYNLEQNYRSTKNIIEAAKNLISKNSSHIPLNLWTSNAEGEKLSVYQGLNEVDEALFITGKIKERILEGGYSFAHFCVLYRTNAQSRSIEEMFLKEGIPYRLIGGVRFYSRKEIKDLISYLRVIYNPFDKVSWERVINTPPRGIGKKSQERLETENYNLDKVEALTKLPFKIWQEQKELATTLEFLNSVLEKTKYVEWVDDGSEESLSRIENIKELKSVATLFPLLGDFLDNVSLVEQDSARRNSHENDAVTLMTIHAAKGLEFPVVFLVGMEEGLFPHSRSLMEISELEEERRLCYVAITRAKEKVFLTHTRSRLYFGKVQAMIISRFLIDIPEEFLDFKLSDQGLSKPVFNASNFEIQKFLDKLEEERL